MICYYVALRSYLYPFTLLFTFLPFLVGTRFFLPYLFVTNIPLYCSVFGWCLVRSVPILIAVNVNWIRITNSVVACLTPPCDLFHYAFVIVYDWFLLMPLITVPVVERCVVPLPSYLLVLNLPGAFTPLRCTRYIQCIKCNIQYILITMMKMMIWYMTQSAHTHTHTHMAERKKERKKISKKSKRRKSNTIYDIWWYMKRDIFYWYDIWWYSILSLYSIK